MRDQKRIRPFLKEVGEIWNKYPTLRFGQLILNTTKYPNGLYYIEEDSLLDDLRRTYCDTVEKVIIIGAAGRDFHNFNVFFKDNKDYEVVAFTATQIPGIDDKIYPTELAGELYPNGIPIYPESELTNLIVENNVHLCVFAYSDVTYDYIENIRYNINEMIEDIEFFDCDLIMLTPEQTQLKSTKPVISVTATRTGCGKSSVSKGISEELIEMDYKVGVIRHPMPYADDLNTQAVQRFETEEDLKVCTIEEREEYEPYVRNGMVIWAGIDYESILREAEKECDIILWDGGNNDFSFIKSDYSIVVADPLRVGDELKYYPSDINIKNADVVVINKMDSAIREDIMDLEENILNLNPDVEIMYTKSIVTTDNDILTVKANLVVIEDGPTLTHGGMRTGAGVVSLSETSYLVDAKPYAVGTIKDTYEKYPHLDRIIPAMGYSDEQLKDLEETINSIPCDAVVIATPCDLCNLIHIEKPVIMVSYDIEDIVVYNLVKGFFNTFYVVDDK